MMDLSADHWEGLKPTERKALAQRLAKQLPSGFALQAIRRFQLGEAQHHVALYEKDEAAFAFIPGARIALGYDADRPWEPTSAELESWQETSEEYEISKTIREYACGGGQPLYSGGVTMPPATATRQISSPRANQNVAPKGLAWIGTNTYGRTRLGC